MPDEDNTIKKNVQIDLEIDTTHVDIGKNPFQKVIFAAKAIDSWRIFPRIFITVYIFLLFKTVMWFMLLDNPTTEQAGLVSVVTGVGLGWFSAYVKSGSNRKEKSLDEES